MNQNKQKYISFAIIILVIALGTFFVLNGKKVDAPVDTTGIEVKDNVSSETEVPNEDVVPVPDKTDVKPNTNNTQTNLTKEQQDLLVRLQKSVNARDYESFSDALLEVYKNQWTNVADFIKLESNLYVYTYDTYYMKGDLENSLKYSSIVFYKVPEAWRFRYLRIMTLEKYGRNAFAVNDLNSAEGYAKQILQMTFRLEGTNLLADVYISKINTNIKDGNTALAKQNLGFIWDYEVSADRRTTLTTLKTQLGL
ncbi:hypothetical protein COU48_01730 [Candidatus Nomurabacteria bacterium CG10_big_fil_rev_8_21_14_0_10_03_31_7]|uniref:Uncharacterized protein n=1 Tax=Candidatus Nomurabacteria bacterium CG10_big_fil_rev_8_21_14_0_10_03_31_7 TaxID=1974730 RepID=A0A2J0JHV3_9BACT|nr:MAG: hypothetical protein COU48_01730 [Candidatus Nomurabacteria bacterium CG10_big_fil_rev_8_21_14_0_10_03_31_7]